MVDQTKQIQINDLINDIYCLVPMYDWFIDNRERLVLDQFMFP